jgi:hypothetical protein
MELSLAGYFLPHSVKISFASRQVDGLIRIRARRLNTDTEPRGYGVALISNVGHEGTRRAAARKKVNVGTATQKKVKPGPKLKPLRWVMTDRSGKRHIHEIPNPIEGIVNKFNETYAAVGMKAESA